MLAVPQGSPPGDPTAFSGPCALFHPEPRPAPETRVPREGGEGQARTWWVVTKQEALELHFLARRHPEDRLRSHGNGQTAAGRRSACAGPCVLRAPGSRSSEPRLRGEPLAAREAEGRRGCRSPARRGRGARPAPAIARICLGVLGVGGGAGAPEHGGEQRTPRRCRHAHLHLSVPGPLMSPLE